MEATVVIEYFTALLLTVSYKISGLLICVSREGIYKGKHFPSNDGNFGVKRVSLRKFAKKCQVVLWCS